MKEMKTISFQPEMVNWNGQYAIFKCSAITNKGQFVGYGTANSQRDARLAESLVELAETRSIARALRFAGLGLNSHRQKKFRMSSPKSPKDSKTPAKSWNYYSRRATATANLKQNSQEMATVERPKVNAEPYMTLRRGPITRRRR